MAAARKWFITGVGSGLGRAIADAALARGDQVAGSVRQAAQRVAFDALVPGRSRAFLADVTDERGLTGAITAAAQAMGGLDVVVVNAGYGLFGAVEECGSQEVRAQFETNVMGAWNTLRAALPHLRSAGMGNVLLLSSVAGVVGSPGAGAYNASKFALEGMGEALAQELAPLGIAVTIVEPGAFKTAFAGGSARFASLELDAYPAGSRGQKTRLAALNNNQPGDPAKAAQAMLTVVDASHPPVRLMLGEDALRRARGKLEWMQREMETWEGTSNATRLEGAPEGGGLPPFSPPVLKR